MTTLYHGNIICKGYFVSVTKSNPALLEWLNSPIVYLDRFGLADCESACNNDPLLAKIGVQN
jgi:hypothetical protein